MATASVAGDPVERSQGQNESPAFRRKTACIRCGGLLVRDFSMDMLAAAVALKGETVRCVQCGDVVDPVIRRNRGHQYLAGKTIVENTTGSSIHGQRSM